MANAHRREVLLGFVAGAVRVPLSGTLSAAAVRTEPPGDGPLSVKEIGSLLGQHKVPGASLAIIQNGEIVGLYAMRQLAGTEATSERAEPLANLLTLSYEPMLAWRLDGSFEFWNAGAERLYGFVLDEAIGRSSHSLLQTKFPIDFIELRSQLWNERYWKAFAS